MLKNRRRQSGKETTKELRKHLSRGQLHVNLLSRGWTYLVGDELQRLCKQAVVQGCVDEVFQVYRWPVGLYTKALKIVYGLQENDLRQAEVSDIAG